MFDLLGRAIAQRPRITVAGWALVTILLFTLAMTGFGGQGLFERLHSGQPTVPDSESDDALTMIEEHAEDGDAVTAHIGGVDLEDPEDLSAAVSATTTTVSQLMAIDEVERVVSPLLFEGGPQDPAAQPLISHSSDGFLMTVTLNANASEAELSEAIEEVTERLEDFGQEISDQATVTVSSEEAITEEIISQMERDLITGELVALPISLLIMVVVFGGFLTAGMPLAGAIASIAGGLGVLLGFSHVMQLDSVVVNVVTILGLGLSIDYGLLIVSRYREEIHAAHNALETAPTRRRSRRHAKVDPIVLSAARNTLSTAGRTVSYSALIIAISVLGLVFLRPDILRSLGLAGVAVVVIALLTALTLVPALLVLRGRRMLNPSVIRKIPGLRRVLGALGEVAPTEGVFSRLAGGVQKRPVAVMVVVGAVLLLLASPLLNLNLRNSTEGMLPSDSQQREFFDTLRQDYPLVAAPTMNVLVQDDAEGAGELATQIAQIEDVQGVDDPVPSGTDHVILGVRVDTDDAGDQVATAVVHEIRDLRAHDYPTFWVYGDAPNQIDFTDALLDGLPLAGGIVVLAVFVLLFAMTGSLLIPAKALIVNLLSIAASLGITAWIFQEGHLEGLLNFTSAGGLESYVVAVVVAFGFGLAMDYEVFLLARIKEIYDDTGDNNHAVKYGLQRSGRIITSAALVIIVVFLGFVAGDLIAIKQAGVALAITVFIDATLVRMLLVPSSMTLLGKYNWWAPAPLRRFYQRHGLKH